MIDNPEGGAYLAEGGAYLAEGGAYLVMEYVDMKDLGRSAGKLGEQLARFVYQNKLVYPHWRQRSFLCKSFFL